MWFFLWKCFTSKTILWITLCPWNIKTSRNRDMTSLFGDHFCFWDPWQTQYIELAGDAVLSRQNFKKPLLSRKKPRISPWTLFLKVNSKSLGEGLIPTFCSHQKPPQAKISEEILHKLGSVHFSPFPPLYWMFFGNILNWSDLAREDFSEWFSSFLVLLNCNESGFYFLWESPHMAASSWWRLLKNLINIILWFFGT